MKPARGWAWLSWLLAFSSGFILLGGIIGSQNQCSSPSQDFDTIADTIFLKQGGYLSAAEPCHIYYSLTWWITVYQIIIACVASGIISLGHVHRWRYGVIGLLSSLFYLLCSTANSFAYTRTNSKSETAVFAGAIIGSVGNAGLMIVLGLRDEDAGPMQYVTS
jgi:uncharacterized membrane protein YeiB